MKQDTPEVCSATHAATGAHCELPAGHIENHRGPFDHGIAQWPEGDGSRLDGGAVRIQPTPDPSVTTDPWKPLREAFRFAGVDSMADLLDAALTLDRQQHQQALDALRAERDRLKAIALDTLACWQGQDEQTASIRHMSAQSRATLRARLAALTPTQEPTP